MGVWELEISLGIMGKMRKMGVMGLPAEGLFRTEPFTLRPEHLLDNIASTSVASCLPAHVARYFLDIRTGICWTTRAATHTHNLHVGDIVANIHNLLVGEAIFLLELIVGLNLHGTSHIDVLHAKALVAHADALGGTTGKDDDAQSFLLSQLNGIAVFDVYRAKGLAVSIQCDGLSAQHPVDIEDDGAYLG